MIDRENREPGAGSSGIVIDCSDCLEQRTEACDDCIVAYLIDRPEGAVIFDAAEERAIRTLRAAGLLPDVRYGKQEAG